MGDPQFSQMKNKFYTIISELHALKVINDCVIHHWHKHGLNSNCFNVNKIGENNFFRFAVTKYFNQ